MIESRFVVNINRALNVIFAFGLLVLWLAVLPDGIAFPPLRVTQTIIPNKIHPILISYIPRTMLYTSVSQPPGRGPVPGPGINYTGPREILLEFVILVF